MQLLDLAPKFVRHEKQIADKHHGRPREYGTTQWGGFEVDTFVPVKKMREAHGIWFLCPKCFAAGGGPKGTHHVSVYFTGAPVPPEIGTNKDGQTVRWSVTGKRYADLTLAPSIQIQGGCDWHGYVRGGTIEHC